MKQILNCLFLLSVTLPKTISLGEMRIQGDTEHPTINFLIPRIRIDFLDKKDIIQEIAQPVKSDIFEVK